MSRTGSGNVDGSNFLLGVATEEITKLNIRCANQMPHWTEFKESGKCSVACGGGVIDDVRRCVGGKIGGFGCPG